VSLYSKNVPVLEDVRKFAMAGIVPGGSENNLDYVKNQVIWPDNLSRTERLILCDAQTSGGLLIAVSKADTDSMVDKMKQAGLDASVIGMFDSDDKGSIKVM